MNRLMYYQMKFFSTLLTLNIYSHIYIETNVEKNGDASVRPHKNVFGNSTNENSRCEYSRKKNRAE